MTEKEYDIIESISFVDRYITEEYEDIEMLKDLIVQKKLIIRNQKMKLNELRQLKKKYDKNGYPDVRNTRIQNEI